MNAVGAVGSVPGGAEREVVPLGEVCSIKYGKAKPRSIGDVPVFGSGGPYGTTVDALTGPSSLVIGRKGSAGSVWWPASPSWPSDTTFYLEPDALRVDTGFLYYYLLAHPLSGAHAQTTMPSLQKVDLQRLPIPLAPMQEQRQIAQMLSTIQRSHEATRAALRRTSDVKRTMVAEAFQLDGQEIVSCADVCDVLSVGIVVRPSQYYTKDGVLALRSQNVHEDELDLSEIVRIDREAHRAAVAKSALRPGDVVIVRTGYPGTSAVIPEELTEVNCIDLVFARPSSRVHPEYLSRFFNSPSGRSQALAAKTGLAQQHLNVGAVGRTRLPLPAAEVQLTIVKRLRTVDRVIRTTREQLRCLDVVFASALNQLLGGAA